MLQRFCSGIVMRALGGGPLLYPCKFHPVKLEGGRPEKESTCNIYSSAIARQIASRAFSWHALFHPHLSAVVWHLLHV